MGAPLELVENIQVHTDGKIVLTARMDNVSYGTNTGYIARFEANGTMDASFGSGYGILTSELPQGWIHTGAIQPDGKVLILTSPYINNSYVSMIARYLADGTPDTTFGDMGTKIVTGGIGHFYCKDMLVQPDGKIVIAGQAELTEGLAAFCFARLTGDGNFDTGFGINGVSIFNSTLQGITDKIALQPDGKIVAAGKVYNSVFGVTRCNTDGTVDTSFGINGRAEYNTESTNDYITGTAIQPDGKILVGGTFYHTGGTPNFMLMRYLNDSTANLSENTLKSFAAYPNPAQNTLYIQNTDNIAIDSLTVTDVTGKTLIKQNGSIRQIDISPLPQGIYLLKIASSTGTTTLKFIKQ